MPIARGPQTVAALLALLALTSYASGAPPRERLATPPTEIRYQGMLYLEAHFKFPGDVHAYHSEERYSTDQRTVRLDWTTWADDDTARVPETFLLAGVRLFHRDAPTEPWRLTAGETARLGRTHVLAGFPEQLLSAAQAHPTPGTAILRRDGLPSYWIQMRAHPRLGDVRDSVVYSYGSGPRAPDSVAMAFHQRDQQWRMGERRTSWSSNALPESLLAVPATFEPATASRDTLSGPPQIVPIAEGVWSFDMTDIDSRTLIVEFADYLAVIEAAVGSANGERIVDAARQRWPWKPIRYACFSHYHPHYAGGLRAFIAEGATVMTTPGNEAFVRNVAALPFTVAPDRLALHPRPLALQTFADRTEIADSTNRLVAINYGPRSQHTDEFVVFWLPRQKLLFETELGWVRNAGTLRASRRAGPLLAWIDEQKLGVDRVIQSWPMRDNEAMVSRALLDSLVKARR